MRIIAIAFVLLLAFQSSIFSQKDSSGKTGFIIKTDMLMPAIGLFSKSCWTSLTVEKIINSKNSIQLSGLFAFHNDKSNCEAPYSFGSYLKYKTYQAIIDYKYFLEEKKNFSNFFIGLYSKYINNYQKIDYYGDWSPYYQFLEEKESSLALGPLFGFQNCLSKKISYEFIVGTGICHVINYTEIDKIGMWAVHSTKNHLDLRIAINIGYKF